MSIISLASYQSAWRGYEYYSQNKVVAHRQVDESCYEGQVSGSYQNLYDISINLKHPRSSKCNCPYADGKKIVCKHMVALYFACFPEEASEYYREVIEAEEEAEREREEEENAVIAVVSKMKKADLQQALLQVLFDGPEWQYDRFIEEYVGE